MNSFCTFWTLCETKHRLTNAARGCLAFFVPVCGLCASSADKTENFNLLHVVRDDQGMSIVLGYSRRSKQYASVGLNWAIRCSYDSEHKANRLTATWPVVLRVTLKERQRERQKRKDCWWLRWCSQCCVLLLCMSHCWRPSLSGQSRVSPETPASLLECPGGNSAPGGKG